MIIEEKMAYINNNLKKIKKINFNNKKKKKKF